MSRLDSFIRRLEAQRRCLDVAREQIAGVPGPVLELGLGNGRTYDHLRELFPEREIFVFEMKVSAHPSCIPDPAHLFLGDFLERLPEVTPRFAGQVALVHADCCGSGQRARDAAVVAGLERMLAPLMARGGLILSDGALAIPGTEPVALPAGVAPGRYFMLRRSRAA